MQFTPCLGITVRELEEELAIRRLRRELQYHCFPSSYFPIFYVSLTKLRRVMRESDRTFFWDEFTRKKKEDPLNWVALYLILETF